MFHITKTFTDNKRERKPNSEGAIQLFILNFSGGLQRCSLFPTFSSDF